jgi:hypothetical protein
MRRWCMVEVVTACVFPFGPQRVASCTIVQVVHPPLVIYYQTGRHVPIKANAVTDVLRLATTMDFHRTGIAEDEVSARSLRAGGAMALLSGQVDMDHIRMMGRWHSDAMMRHLHMQAGSVVGGLCRSHV